MGDGILRCHNLKLPEEIAVFSVPVSGIRRWDDIALVYDVRIGEEFLLRHYAFYDRWFAVNVAMNRRGEFVIETRRDGIKWCFNCDIAAPLYSVGQDAAYTVDLEVDVLAETDGRTHVVMDEDDFARSIAAGWIDTHEAAGARAGLADLLAIIHSDDGLLGFLQSACPLENAEEGAPLQPPPRMLWSLDDAPLLKPDVRRSRYGTATGHSSL